MVVGLNWIKNQYPLYFGETKVVSPFRWRHIISFEERYHDDFDWLIHKPYAQQGDNSIMIFGCSFAYGYHIPDDQRLSYKLSREMKTTIYNWSAPGWGTQHMMWQLQHGPLSYGVKEPKYIIYVFIEDHLRRLDVYSEISEFIFRQENIAEPLRYTAKMTGEWSRRHDVFPVMRHTMLANLVMFWAKQQILEKFDDAEFMRKPLNLLKALLMESKKIANKRWPNAKFVILDYENMGYSFPEFWKQMESEGFIYINSRRDFDVGSQDIKYRVSETDFHPNGRAWDVIVPQLAKKLKNTVN